MTTNKDINKDKILLTGATGFIGKQLCLHLAKQGHHLVLLTRSQRKPSEMPFPCEIFQWNIVEAPPLIDFFYGVTTVINLAGESISEHRWTKKEKEKIYQSRIIGTRNLIKTIENSEVKLIISSSAVGFYGHRDDETLTESSTPGNDFLANVCQLWEKEILAAQLTYTRRIVLRMGVVLGRGGGFLNKLLPIFRMGMGSSIGSGHQWMSWIHIQDLISLIDFIITHSDLQGPINAMSPLSVTNNDFTHALCNALQAPPLPFHTPLFIIQAIFGEKTFLATSSQKTFPEQAIKSGFQFQFSDLNHALSDLIPSEKNVDEEINRFWLPFSKSDIFTCLTNEDNTEHLSPPVLNYRLLSKNQSQSQKNTILNYRIWLFGLPLKWICQITQFVPNSKIEKTQIKGFFTSWVQTLIFESLEEGTLVTQIIKYKVPFGRVGFLIFGNYLKRKLKYTLQYRRVEIIELFNNIYSKSSNQ